MAECLLVPATRNVQQVTVEDVEEADKMFDILMGTNVEPRRKYFLEHAEEAVLFE